MSPCSIFKSFNFVEQLLCWLLLFLWFLENTVSPLLLHNKPRKRTSSFCLEGKPIRSAVCRTDRLAVDSQKHSCSLKERTTRVTQRQNGVAGDTVSTMKCLDVKLSERQSHLTQLYRSANHGRKGGDAEVQWLLKLLKGSACWAFTSQMAAWRPFKVLSFIFYLAPEGKQILCWISVFIVAF